jgi:hypothetical protein
MAIEPDNKDWTWVLDRPCAECGFDASSLPTDDIAPLVRTNAAAWLTVLAEPDDLLRRRPRDDPWSALEYACHVRDVFVLFGQRLHLMLTSDNPVYPNWDQDRSAVDDRYIEQGPALVASQLTDAASRLALDFDAVGGEDWHRRGRRSDGADFTVTTFGRYMVHDPIHHLHDVTIDLDQLKGG